MYYAALHRKKQQLNPAICATRPRLSAQAAHVFGRRHARDGAELTGKVLLAGKVELFCDLAHGQRSAAQQELDLLPGIGPAKAAAILEYREQHGPFLEPDGLLEVPGIGETLFGDIADYICVDAQEEDP